MIIPLFFIFLAYILQPSFAYSAPFDVFQLIILEKESGTTLFAHINEFRGPKSKAKQDMSLKSPALMAIQTLIKEIAYAEGQIKQIELSDRKIIFENVGEAVCVVIASKSSYFLIKGIRSFVNEFYETFEKQIIEFNGNVSIFAQRGREMLLKYLPFFRHEGLGLN